MKEKNDLTHGELKLMNILWELGHEASTAQILEQYQEQYGERLTSQAVGGCLGKLENKGYLKITKPDHYYKVYTPLVDKKTYMGKQMNYWADFWGESAVDYAIMGLSGKEGFTEDEIQKLKGLLEELD